MGPGPPVLLVGVVVFAQVLVACSPAGAATPEAATPVPAAPTRTLPPGVPTPTRLQLACPRLHGALVHLLEAPDPAAYAQRAALRYEDGRVFVAISHQAPADDLAQRYGLRVPLPPSLSGYLEAWALLATLCDLSNDPRVRLVDPVTMMQSPKPSRPK
ncbi:MAG: hypothetical protein HY690_11435 [Chloroflexi bacterium]|nr:hypothetical protein [Chloroflexota bacterium]